MDRILLSTVAYRSPEEVFPYVRSFTDYPRYTEHLTDVRKHDGSGIDGGNNSNSNSDSDSGSDNNNDIGTIYDLRLSWWKLNYTARSKVTGIEAPTSLEWHLQNHLDARGEWRVEAEPSAAPPGEETASRIYFEAVYDPHSADPSAISLPRFVSLDWVIGKVKPRLLDEAKEVVRRLVADIEGEPREVELTVHELP